MDTTVNSTQLRLRQAEMDALEQQWHELEELRAILQRDYNILRDRVRDNIRYLTEQTHYDPQDSETRIDRARELSDYEFNIRQCIRAFFALVEAMAYRYKVYAVSLPQSHYNFTQDEVDIAYETGKRRIGFYDNLNYSIDFLRKAFNISFNLNKGSHNFESFKIGVKLRDRLMHPKDIEDVSPHDYTEYTKFVEGSNWYYDQMAELLELVHVQLQNAQTI